MKKAQILKRFMYQGEYHSTWGTISSARRLAESVNPHWALCKAEALMLEHSFFADGFNKIGFDASTKPVKGKGDTWRNYLGALVAELTRQYKAGDIVGRITHGKQVDVTAKGAQDNEVQGEALNKDIINLYVSAYEPAGKLFIERRERVAESIITDLRGQGYSCLSGGRDLNTLNVALILDAYIDHDNICAYRVRCVLSSGEYVYLKTVYRKQRSWFCVFTLNANESFIAMSFSQAAGLLNSCAGWSMSLDGYALLPEHFKSLNIDVLR